MLGRSIKCLCCAERNLDTKMGKGLASEDACDLHAIACNHVTC